MQGSISAKDLLKGEAIPAKAAGWYPARCISAENTTAQSTGVDGRAFVWEIVAGPYTGYQATERWWENAPGFSKKAMLALGAKIDSEGNLPFDWSDEFMLGKYVDINLSRGESSKLRPFNQINDYAPIGTISKFKPAETSGGSVSL